MSPSQSPDMEPDTTAELLDLAQEAGRVGIFEWRVAERKVHLSPQCLSIYGIDDFDGRFESWLGCIFREDRLRISHLMESAFAESAQEMQAEFRIAPGDRTPPRWIEARHLIFYDAEGQASRVIGVNVDITDRKRALVQLHAFAETLEEAVKARTRELEAENEARRKAEEALRQAQKMEAIGRLTGGIAHDFNNLLTVVVGGLDIIARQMPALGETPSALRVERARDMAMQGVQRAVTLTRRLLAFSRQQPLAPMPLDINQLVAGACEFLARSLGEATELETVLAAGLWRGFADSNELENALLNLAVNANDAMPDGGKLTVETSNCYLDEAYVAGLAEPVQPGQYVLIAVADTGTGMDAATIEKAFDPFFTTKEPGKGTGLGLSQVYGFVRQSAGHVRIYSEPGEGTTVKIYLPRHRGMNASTEDAAHYPAAVSDKGNETIPLVEDDDRLRTYTAEMLSELGYRVLEAATASAALALLASEEQVDLLFTDVVMPGGVNGRQLATAALERRPSLKVLFTTGYTRNAIVHHGRLDPGVELITKPFSLKDLSRKVRDVLDAQKRNSTL
jgi:signal transduction histidine kinase/ActR/RegA family two-component response regulator